MCVTQKKRKFTFYLLDKQPETAAENTVLFLSERKSLKVKMIL